jgi:hypothetical protein
MEKLSAKVENWSVVDNLIFHGFRKLEPGMRLTGYIKGHADIPNGVIFTSVIQNVDQIKGLVETTNTVYELGQVNEVYEHWNSEQHLQVPEPVRIPSFVSESRRPVNTYPAVGSMPAFRRG